ncbi:MAG: ribonucleotide-diphosphate reductase subunit beta [Comamonas sp.]|nr:ribonucleotide-diphosphate reductase subunit beta [Comamonas sp.]
MTDTATDTVFNYDKTDYEKPLLLLGQRPGLFDTVNRHYPEIWKLYKAQKSLDWDENEFDYSSCNADFKSCSRATYDMMIKTLAWQWEADSVASRAIAPVLAPFITSSELWAAWQRISDNEVVHAATYSEIVRNSFDDPSVILDEILRVQEAHDRLGEVARAFAEGYEASHKYAIGQLPNDQATYNAVFMTIVALLCMERIQFMASFAVTFAICDTGLFQPIGKAIQKIAQDELEIHVELDRAVLLNELKTERGQTAFAQCRASIEKMIEEVVDSELRWIDYLFSEGRELVGMNADRLSAWTLYCAKDVYQLFGLTTDKYQLPAHNPLKFMEKWLNISKTQASPQEQDIAAYKVGVMRRTDENQVFDVDF